LSGFFLLRRAAIDLDRLHPQGFKILLEILVRHPGLRVAEVGYGFGIRAAGTSKASLREAARYLSLLVSLRFGEDALRFARFAAVGASGLVVNTLALALIVRHLGVHYLLGVVLATQVSTLWLFGLTEVWVYADRGRGRQRFGRMLAYFAMNNAALSLRGPAVYALTSLAGLYYLVSNVVSLVALTVLRFAIADSWIWGRQPEPASYGYDIHGLVTVRSTVPLPELAVFRTTRPIERPTIDVRTAWRMPRRPAEVSGFRYDEHLGPFGFWMDVALGPTIDVVTSPLLRRSPHVLYTNVVEPILRWTFVQQGYALVHGACLAFGSDAYLVTARTDTGKTTTILRILARQRRASDRGVFLSDDLTLVSPSGRVLPYPKPLTISAHTVAAVDTSRLTRRERLGLRLQSRIHSRGGRRVAFLLTRTGLPVATINAVTQWLVPPPKYPVQRLVPQVRVAPEAWLAGLFV
ncbi:MAG: GtrA family protein, partial [Thermomicrobiaceae bacterium]|nr:GtrA family protein [Thermomicrobiaceae bacterium]